MTISLLKSPGLLSVFWPILMILYFQWSPLVHLFPISKSSSPCSNPLLTALSVTVTIGITVTFVFHSVFSSPVRSRYLSFFSFVQYSAGSLSFFLLFYYHLVWSSGRDQITRLYLKIIIIIVINITNERFSYQCKLTVFHWRLSDSKSPQVSRTLFNNAFD